MILKPHYLLAAVVLSGCQPAIEQRSQISASDIIGSWYTTSALEQNTRLIDIEFREDGSINSNEYICFARSQIQLTTERGNWKLDNGDLTIVYLPIATKDEDNNERSSISPEEVWRITELSEDSARLDNQNYRSAVNLVRRWSNQRYNCSTTKQQIDQDHQKAIENSTHQHTDQDP